MTIPDFKKNGIWMQSSYVSGNKEMTISGSVWQDINQRCTEGSSVQKRFPCYKGVENRFNDFQSFVDWHTVQIGYGKRFQIDKDILNPNCKYYSEETCILVPDIINNLVKWTKKKSGLPRGVFKSGPNFRACLQIDGVINYLGSFKTVEAASRCYLNAKITSLKEIAEVWKQEIDPRLYNILKNPENLLTHNN